MSFQWVDPTSDELRNAVVGGVDRDGTLLCVARAPHGEDTWLHMVSLIPGKWRSAVGCVCIR